MWYPVKVLHIMYNLFAGTETLSLSVYEPIAIHIGAVLQIGAGVELGSLVWYRVKVLRLRYNLFAGTETLSLSVYELIAMQIFVLGTVPPIWGSGLSYGSSVVPLESTPY